jgi:Zn finger protein HypA/HybF involved in hydrogenase expression
MRPALQSEEVILKKVKDSLKCLRCGFEYNIPVDPKREVTERLCPKCKSNSVREIGSQKETRSPN